MRRSESRSGRGHLPQLGNLLFVGLNSKVIALDRESGDLIWTWKTPKGHGFVTLLLDGDQLIAAVSGYVSCLAPQTGELIWHNPLKGMGSGYTSLVSVYGGATPVIQAAMAAQQKAAAAGTTGGT
jgi:outer membrane protein assembly factor BamB